MSGSAFRGQTASRAVRDNDCSVTGRHDKYPVLALAHGFYLLGYFGRTVAATNFQKGRIEAVVCANGSRCETDRTEGQKAPVVYSAREAR